MSGIGDDSSNEVARRLARIENDPALRALHDADGSGRLESSEYAKLERLVRAQLKAEEELAEMDAADHVGQRYVLDYPLGQGGQAQTFLAKDHETGERVVIKRLLLAHLDDWKAIELFEREGEVLEHLEHASIPSYVDAMHAHGEAGDAFYLVQQYVEGPTLADEIARGRRFTEDEVEELARELLDVLEYLHELNPPVIHRDLKPSNIICKKDGGYALIDFGAIQAVLPRESRLGSTIVGTSGYMAPEQFMGRSVPATDLYALGATLAHAMSHVHPNDMSVVRMKLDVRPHLGASEKLVQWVERLVEPAVEDRFASADEAITGLDELHQQLTRPAPVAVERVESSETDSPTATQTAEARISLIALALISLTATAGVAAGLFASSSETEEVEITSAMPPLELGAGEKKDGEAAKEPRGLFADEREATEALLGGAEVVFKMPAGQEGDLGCSLYRYADYTGNARVGLECVNTSGETLTAVKADVRLEREDGTPVVGKSEELVNGVLVPMRAGDTLHEGIDLGDIQGKEEIARLVVDVVQCAKETPEKLSLGGPVELTWMVAKPEGVDIEVRVRSEGLERSYNAGKYDHRSLAQIEHKGVALLDDVQIEKRVYDSAGKLVASEEAWAHGVAGPPLRPGQIKAFSTWTTDHAKPARVEYVVLDADLFEPGAMGEPVELTPR